MLYFSYGHDLNDRSLAEWYDHNRLRAQPPRKMTAAVVNNFRIAFPVFSSYWQGGVAGLIPEPGKRVAGAIFQVSEKQLERLAEFNDARLDDHAIANGGANGGGVNGIGANGIGANGAGANGIGGRGSFRPTTITVSPYAGGDAVEAITFVPVKSDDGYVPPTKLYMERLVEAALDLDLSAFWLMHLRSFPTGPEESSRYFPKRRIVGPGIESAARALRSASPLAERLKAQIVVPELAGPALARAVKVVA